MQMQGDRRRLFACDERIRLACPMQTQHSANADDHYNTPMRRHLSEGAQPDASFSDGKTTNTTVFAIRRFITMNMTPNWLSDFSGSPVPSHHPSPS